jgi:ABC-type Na+ efflux pump permease subunit
LASDDSSFVTGTSYDWNVPTPRDNKARCRSIAYYIATAFTADVNDLEKSMDKLKTCRELDFESNIQLFNEPNRRVYMKPTYWKIIGIIGIILGLIALIAGLALCMLLGTFAKSYKSAQTLTFPNLM